MNQESEFVCCVPDCFTTHPKSKRRNSLDTDYYGLKHTAFYGLKLEWMMLLKKYFNKTFPKKSWNSINLRSNTICAQHLKLSGIPNHQSQYYLDAPVFFPYLKIGVSTKPATVQTFNFVQFCVDADEGVGREETFPIIQDDILQNMEEKTHNEEQETQECLHLEDHTYAIASDVVKASEIEIQKFYEKQMADLRSANHKLRMQIMIKEHHTDHHFKNILENEMLLKYYTGFNFVGFLEFSKLLNYDYSIAWLTDDAKWLRRLKKSREYRKQLIMVLAKLRLGLLHDDLAYRFNTSVKEVSVIWTFFFSFLKDTLSKYAHVLCAPEAVICDTVAFTCKAIILRECNGFSNKQYTQAKGLLKLTPNGFIQNASNLFVDRLSESQNLMEDDQKLKTIFLSTYQKQLLKKIKSTGPAPLPVKTRVDRISALISEFRILKGVYTAGSSGHAQLNIHWRICSYLMNFIMNVAQ